MNVPTAWQPDQSEITQILGLDDPRVRAINDLLLALYRSWLDATGEPITASVLNHGEGRHGDITQYNVPQFLLCTSAYLVKRIMVCGREAHAKPGCRSNYTTANAALERYLAGNSENLAYDLSIASFAAPMRFYLKARLDVCGLYRHGTANVRENDLRSDVFADNLYKLSAVPTNNLFKTSFRGEYSDASLLRAQNTPFTFRGHTDTVARHELRVMRPEKVVFWCGDLSKEKKAFAREAFQTDWLPDFPANGENRWEDCVFNVGIRRETIPYLWCSHPSRRFSADQRGRWMRVIHEFLDS